MSVRGVSLAFGGLTVLNEVSIDVPQGSVVAIVGPNGSGKTSLLNCISGVYQPHAGQILFEGTELRGKRPPEITKLGIARTFQGVEIPRNLTVAEIGLLGRHLALSAKYGFVAYGLGIPRLNGAERRERDYVVSVAEQIGLGPYVNDRVSGLPFGLAKRADILRALCCRPQVLLLDEPAAGLTVTEKAELISVIKEVADGSVTVCVVEHDMGFLEQVSTLMAVMVSGQVVFEGSVADGLARPEVAIALHGLSDMADDFGADDFGADGSSEAVPAGVTGDETSAAAS
ncbi:MAG: ATP-binding cassette domain-containing protein [Actinomycetia bacterium]|nr:ATP-binding cassette domain-containing protein [Actinomycetes bacterium]